MRKQRSGTPKLLSRRDAKAQYNLGLMYAQWKVVPEKLKDVLKWVAKAAAARSCRSAIQIRDMIR